MQQRHQNRGHRELQVSADMHWLRQTKCCHQLHTRQVGGKRRKENVREKSRDIIDYNLFSKRGRKAFSAWDSRWRDRCWQLSWASKTKLIQLYLRAIEPEIAVNWKELSNMINNCPSHQMAHRIYQSYRTDLSHQLLFPELLRGQTRQSRTAATVEYYPENPFRICVKARQLRRAQGAALCSQVFADPLISLGVCMEFIPCTSVQFRDFGKSACARSINKNEKAAASWPRAGWYPRRWEGGLPLNRNSLLGAQTQTSDTKAALPFSAGLVPRLFCLFISRHHAHSLDATRFHSVFSELDPNIWKKISFLLK